MSKVSNNKGKYLQRITIGLRYVAHNERLVIVSLCFYIFYWIFLSYGLCNDHWNMGLVEIYWQALWPYL